MKICVNQCPINWSLDKSESVERNQVFWLQMHEKTLKNAIEFVKTGDLIAKNLVSWLLSKLEILYRKRMG